MCSVFRAQSKGMSDEDLIIPWSDAKRKAGARMKPFHKFAFAALLIVASEPALASGEIYKRIVSETNVAKCGDGKIVERLHTGGNMHGFFSAYFLACLQSPERASWVLLSGISCDDPSDRPKRCDTKFARTLPPFVTDNEFWRQEEAGRGPYAVNYKLLRFGIGRDCHVVTQSYNQEGGSFAGKGSANAWLCEDIKAWDGTNFDGDPRSFKAFTLKTMGVHGLKTFFPEEPFPSKNDDSYEPPTDFLIEKRLYVYDLLQ